MATEGGRPGPCHRKRNKTPAMHRNNKIDAEKSTALFPRLEPEDDFIGFLLPTESNY
jgi:hypothetical protein